MATPSKPQSIPWTHEETIHLIEAYQEKWFSLEKGQLKSNQWEEVAGTIALRCGYNHFNPSKTSIQCRHKMEKLRQRYRAEKQRLSNGTPSYWQYFDLMNNLLLTPLPLSARPIASFVPYHNVDQQNHVKLDSYEEGYEDFDDDDDDEGRKNRGKSRRISYILDRPVIGNGSLPENGNLGDVGVVSGKRGEAEEGDLDEEKGSEVCSKLAAEIRVFADRLVGMENMKLEVMRETERMRMAMEKKRMEMILESEQKIVDSIARAFGSPKRLKIRQDI